MLDVFRVASKLRLLKSINARTASVLAYIQCTDEGENCVDFLAVVVSNIRCEQTNYTATNSIDEQIGTA